MHCITFNKQLLDKKSKIESENILDQTDLYLRAINLSLKLNKKTDTENLITELSNYISTEKQIEI